MARKIRNEFFSLSIVRFLFTFSFLIFTFCFCDAQRGKSGTPPAITTSTVVNEYTSLTANAAAGATTITVAASTLNANGRFPAVLAAGDLILIIQLQGATISARDSNQWDPNQAPRDSSWGMINNYSNCGKWEFGEVYSVPNGTSITLDCQLKNNYTAGGKVIVVRVPRYASLTINNGGTITCDAWNGTIGGICAIEVQNNTTINAGGFIDATGKGFRGGSTHVQNNSFWNLNESAKKDDSMGAEKGEGVVGYQAAGYNIYGGMYCRGAGGNAGGGGDAHNCGGGGGANAGDTTLWNGHGNPDNSVAGYSTAWDRQWVNFSANTSSGGGQGGYSFSASDRNPTTTSPGNTSWGGDNRHPYGGLGGRPVDYSTGRLFLGGGGGSGDQDDNDGGKGGNGGALIYLMNYGTVSGAGTIRSNGNNGSNTTGAGIDGAGGGGAGGTIVINSVGTCSTSITINANGGIGGTQTVNTITTTEAEGPGGGGGGYIAVSSGTPTRTATGGTNGTTNSPGVNPQFPPNGATKGGTGNNNAVVTNFVINAPNVTICAGQAATLTATLTGTVPLGTTIVWYDALVAGNVIGNGSPFITPVLSAGTYTFYVGTCPGTYHQPVIVTATLNGIISAGADVTVCSSASTTLNASGASTYTWSPTTGLSNPNISNPVATPAATTTYICSATTSCGTAKDTVVVNVTSNAVAGISGNTTICSGGTTTLTASGGGNYSWTTGSTGSSITVSPTTNTTYSLFAGSGACADTASVTVTVSSGITASISGNTTICPGSPTTLTATGGSSYSWSTTSTSASITVSPTATSTYSVIASSGTCADTASITLTISNNITAVITGATTICTGGSAILNASGGNNYSWTTGSTGSTITVSPTTNTTYSVIASSGTCADTASATVTVSNGITASISGNTTICPGSPTTLTATGGSSYSWSTTSTAAQITVSPTATSTYSVIASSGTCADTTSITITISNNVAAAISGATTICSGGSITLTASGGNNYSWTTGSTGSSITVSPTANTTYSVIASSGACADTASATVTVASNIVGAIAGNLIVCGGSSTTLTANGGTNYSWSNGSTDVSIIVSPTSNTTYSVIASSGACADTVASTVTFVSSVTASISGNLTVCAGSSTTLNASGGTNYSWSNGNTNAVISVSPTGATSYSVIVSTGTCADTTSASVNVLPVPTPSMTATNLTICGGNPTTLSASGGTTYQWSNGQTTATIIITPGSTTTYSVVAGNGICTGTTSVTVNVLPSPNAVINGNLNICQGSAASLTASGGTSYSWSTGQTTAGINPSAPGSYSVVATTGSCSDAAVANVVVHPLPTATAFSNVLIIQGQSTNLTATGGVSYLWTNNMTGSSITVSPQTTTYYCVTATDGNGCSDTACVTVTVEHCTGTLFLPNAFSPNGDGDNDSLQIYYRIPQCIESLKLIIYNRWGEKVYETNDRAFRWSGIYNSGLLQNTMVGGHEVYAYYLEVKMVDGQSISKKGNISLLK